ncbi:hypothetical protein [Frigidibacter sp. MR17.24]|uniref:hypothetical protein n=1 Tax=Frigidibacter sp. MR17.24 TaxID=3127345 RepID=UPI003012A49B
MTDKPQQPTIAAGPWDILRPVLLGRTRLGSLLRAALAVVAAAVLVQTWTQGSAAEAMGLAPLLLLIGLGTLALTSVPARSLRWLGNLLTLLVAIWASAATAALVSDNALPWIAPWSCLTFQPGRCELDRTARAAPVIARASAEATVSTRPEPVPLPTPLPGPLPEPPAAGNGDGSDDGDTLSAAPGVAPSDPRPPLTPEPPALPEPAPAAAPPGWAGRVFVQYAGFEPARVIALSGTLDAAGWNVQGWRQGGERIASASGLNEVRFFHPADEVAAVALAEQAVTALPGAARLAVRDLSATRFGRATPGQLELWISP